MSAMTEEEAKTKWCPLVRLRTIGDAMRRRGEEFSTGDPDVLCIGSACMAWRVDKAAKHDMSNINKDIGYCGAFGTPT